MTVQYFVADLGTTNLKLALMTTPYQLVESMEVRNVIYQDSEGKHESNPETVFKQFTNLLSQMQAKYPDVNRLIFSSQMHALLAVGTEEKVLQNTMTWADLRAKHIADEMHKSGKAAAFFAQSGTPMHAMNPFVKLAYLKKARPELFQDQSIQFMDIKAYIIRQLTGAYVIDPATASSMGLMDLKHGTWSETLVNEVGVNVNQLPKLVGTTQEIPVKDDIINCLHLAEDFRIMSGSTDGALANLSNLAYPQQAESLSPFVLSFGTSAAVRTLNKPLTISESGQIFTYIVDDQPHYIVGGPLNNAGNVLDWLYQQFNFREKGQSFESMLQTLLTHEFLASGPYFLPFLNGERAPYWNANLQAEFKSIQGHTSQLDMAKAVFEGVFFEIRQVIDLVYKTATIEEKTIQVNGKVFSDPAIAQWIANILGVNLQYVSSDDASLVGAGVLVEGVGLKNDLSFSVVYPQEIYAEKYSKKFIKFQHFADEANLESSTILYKNRGINV